MKTIYLYTKTHNKTGLRYLGKTNSTDPHKYKGSGDYWLPHLEKHGYDVTTEILRECQTNDEVKHWGKHYSQLWNIVDERDDCGKKTWANLKPEEGDGGTTSAIQNKPERLLKNKEGSTRTWKDPVIREKRIKGMILGINRPEVKKAKSESMKVTMEKKLQDQAVLKQYQDIVARNRSLAPVDNNIYIFRHKNGTVEQCTRAELIKKHNLHRGNMSYMINSKAGSVSGWKIFGKVEN
jgi:hypothetical protein